MCEFARQIVAHIRPAENNEIEEILPLGMPGYETWGAVAEELGVVVGHVCLSRSLGKVIGHDWAYWGSDRHGALRLLLRARRQLRNWSSDEQLALHFTPRDSQTLDFWLSRGFQPVVALFERRGNYRPRRFECHKLHPLSASD